MKKLLICTLLLAGAISAYAQGEKEVKTGWSFGLLPTATFSVDNGFQAGAFGDIYNYGDGTTYPDPLHKISWEASYFTKSHRMRLYLAYDSKYLIPGMRINASVTYVNDPLYSFWGYNGPASIQDYDIWYNRETSPNINYYGMSRKMLRGLANVQGRVTDNLNWAAGVNFWKWTLGDMGGANTPYDKDLTLYRRYQKLGAITEAEAKGGIALELNAGLVFDTRDMEAAPNRGVWAEAYLNGNVLNSPYIKACMYFRHYIDIPIHIPAGDPVFAYRLAWQQTIVGETPFYMIQNVPLLVQRNMISEGFGSSNTIRGLRENRVLAEGLAWANTELRVKLVKFKLFKQYFYIAVNPFFDAGVITKPYRADVLGHTAIDPELVFFKGKNDPLSIAGYRGTIYDDSNIKKLIYSAGAGIKIAMNQNFIVSAEYARCFTEGLNADPWIGIGINYQF
ncbi:MAG: hypothetical protein IKH24_00815 [Bacteroidales bacterium]|nr:hypothetical protein [Bacteroidales bacterium]